MAIRDVTAQNAALECWLGDDASTSAPSTWRFLLFHGDPNIDGTELTSAGGYTPATLTNTTAHFPAPSGGQCSATVAFADATGAFSDTVTHWQMVDDANPTVGWFNGVLSNEVDVNAAGPVSIVATIYFGDAS